MLDESGQEDEPPEIGSISLEDLDKIFIDDDRLNRMRDFVKPFIKKLGWREGHVHRRLYNIKNFANGILAKIEKTRIRPDTEAEAKIIELLYTMGYGTKRITYILFTYGYRNVTEEKVRKHVSGNSYKLAKLRDEMLKVIEDTRNRVFQEMGEEVMAAEKRTLILLLKNITAIQDELEDLDPIKESLKFSRLTKELSRLQLEINKMHGVDDYRKASIDVSKSILIEKEKLKLHSDHKNNQLGLGSNLAAGSTDILIIE